MNHPQHPEALVFRLIPPGGRPADPLVEWRVPWQTGPVKEAGVNGVQADDVLEQVQRYLEAVNVAPYINHHTDDAIECIANAIAELRARTHERSFVGTEGTSQP